MPKWGTVKGNMAVKIAFIWNQNLYLWMCYNARIGPISEIKCHDDSHCCWSNARIIWSRTSIWLVLQFLLGNHANMVYFEQFFGRFMVEIIEIKIQNCKIWVADKISFQSKYINCLSISNRTRGMARNTSAVLLAGVSTCGQNYIGPLKASQLHLCQPCSTFGQR